MNYNINKLSQIAYLAVTIDFNLQNHFDRTNKWNVLKKLKGKCCLEKFRKKREKATKNLTNIRSKPF